MLSNYLSGLPVWRTLAIYLVLLGATTTSFALEPEPRKWNHTPIGIDFVGGAYAYTETDIDLDPVLDLENVVMELDTWGVKYVHSFELMGRSARVDLTQAYQEGRWEGRISGTTAAIERKGLSDSFIRVVVNLIGTVLEYERLCLIQGIYRARNHCWHGSQFAIANR